MFYHAKNGRITLDGTEMDYISFGDGPKNLILIPGVGEGLKTVKGTAIPFALAYLQFTRGFTVYVFSRKNCLEEGCSTRDMARDLKAAMDRLGIAKACVVGISLGGMIAQYLAIDAPEGVERLVLAVTLARQNETAQKTIGGWLDMAKSGDYKRILIDSAEKAYSEAYLKKYRRYYPLLTRMGKPKDMGRFLIQAEASLRHNAYGELGGIKCPTLVIGGGCDKVVGPGAAAEIAGRIPGSELVVYPGLGHGAYEEAKDFNQRVLGFCSP